MVSSDEDKRECLKPEHELKQNDNVITSFRVVGKGSTCIVYSATRKLSDGNEQPVIVRELYPLILSGIKRDKNGTIGFTRSNSETETLFEKEKSRFKGANKMHNDLYRNCHSVTTLPPTDSPIEENGTLYLVYLRNEGCVLSEVINSSCELSLSDISKIMMSICLNIFTLHYHGFLYLDLKPENLFYDPDAGAKCIRFFDFGTVCDINNKKEWLSRAAITKEYAPEELANACPANIGFHTDIYEIGMVFFVLLFGRVPTKDDIDTIQNGEFFQPPYKRFLENDMTRPVITQLLKEMLQPDVGKRQGLYQNQFAALHIMGQFEQLGIIGSNNSNRYLIELYDELKKIIEENFSQTNENYKKLIEFLNYKFDEIKNEKGNSKLPKEEALYKPLNPNRFFYKSDSTAFIGREKELNELIEMCLNNSDCLFLWTSICGKAGIGKSRLAAELCNKMLDKKWDVIYPATFSTVKEEIEKKLDPQTSDLLICIDKAATNNEKLTAFLQKIVSVRHNDKFKVRIVLIDRETDGILNDSQELNAFKYSSSLIGECGLKLDSFDEDQMNQIINSYVKTQTGDEKKLSVEDATKILKVLEIIDPLYCRPLYALFITDAWMRGEEFEEWDQKSAYQWLIKDYNERLKEYVKARKTTLDEDGRITVVNGLKALLVCGSFLESYSIDKCKAFLEDYYRKQCLKTQVTKDFLVDGFIAIGCVSKDKKNIEGIKPDLIGEYYCLDFFSNQDDEFVRAVLDLIYGEDFIKYINYNKAIFSDFTINETTSQTEWIKKISTIEIRSADEMIPWLFENCSFIKEVSIFEGITIIEYSAFKYCKNLEIVSYPTTLEKIDDYAFLGCEALRCLPNSIDKILIGKAAFAGCSSLSDERGLIIIANRLFGYCGKETIVTIPSVKTIEDQAFSCNFTIEEIHIPEGVEKVGGCAFKKCIKLRSVHLPNSIIEIGYSCFEGCESLQTVSLPSSLEEIEESSFHNCSSLKKVLLPPSLKRIGAFAFEDCELLEDINIPESIRNIEVGAFMGCVKINKFILSSNKLLHYIGEENEVIIPPVETIGITAFAYNNNIHTVMIPNTVTTIEDAAFMGCKSLENINFPESIQNYGQSIFSGCEKLADSKGFIIFSDKLVQYVGKDKKVTIPDVKVIGQYAFYGNEYIEDIIVPDSVIEIEKGVFAACSSLKRVILSKQLRTIGQGAFSFCWDLNKVSFPVSLTYIGDYAFYDCKSLEFELPNEEIEIGKDAFLLDIPPAI